MRTTGPIEEHASDLLAAAQRFRLAAQDPGCQVAVPDALASLEETLQVLSAAWYQLAGSSRVTTAGLSREREVQLLGTLHDVAAGFARCARMCRDGRSTVTPLIGRARDRGDGVAWVSPGREIGASTHG